MNSIEQYIHDRDEQVKRNIEDADEISFGTRTWTNRGVISDFTRLLVRTNYTKNFTWMGIPILQYPTDLMVMQEIIARILPDVIIEIGIAFGGMTRFYADILEATRNTGSMVVGIDNQISKQTQQSLQRNSLIMLIEGDSVNKDVVSRADSIIASDHTVLVSLDSNHTHDHVLQELQLYAPLVSLGSYIVAFDTAIEEFGHLDKNQDRPWGKGNNPGTAVKEFMKGNKEFIVDREVEQRALITAAPGGWLRRIKLCK
jgi:cephalosporin hydroxylase